ncbi:DUF2505 domain-containing protein [Angustibacter sp. Root456]|uniref:DUF2505 domain-containing protein n=1 Tax=Angustibacter sp. Root456 TaxID=1736539 RepID=UPI0006FAA126|nr:DUF2505 domain-containing protein [Angustibacter sp. Root456]KQX65643.1 hypothetical protein ASD06_08400 [Angustibacter sp. Root456]
MKFRADIRYAADPDRVFEMLLDPAFHEKVCLATGALDHSVDVEPADGGATITTTRKLPADGLPDFVRTFVGETLDVMRVDHWGSPGSDGTRRGTIVVEIQGTPVRLTGTVTMHAGGPGTLEEVEGDLKAAVPLLGGKIERAAEPAVRAAVSKEQEVGNEWLG